MRQFLTILLFAFASCSMQEIEVPATFTDYEYKVGENKYIAFTKNHLYTAWYNKEWREDVSPNVRCSGIYSISKNTLTLNYYEGSSITYQYTNNNGEITLISDQVCTWTRTKLNHYIR